MTKPTPQKNSARIDVNDEKIDNIRGDIKDIRIQVFNHIPTQISNLDDKVDGLAIKLAGVVAIVTIITQYFLKP